MRLAGRLGLGPPGHERAERSRDNLVAAFSVDTLRAINLAAVLSTVEEPWSPRTVGTVNDYDVRVVRTQGEFTRHSHPETDEFFMVLTGSLTIRMDAADVRLGPGEVYIVPKGVHHQPVSPDGATVLLFEPSATVNTGDTPSALTAERRVV
jgi:mannose-6-phosphate isomerase-like protein (cupin superfamily)